MKLVPRKRGEEEEWENEEREEAFDKREEREEKRTGEQIRSLLPSRRLLDGKLVAGRQL